MLLLLAVWITSAEHDEPPLVGEGEGLPEGEGWGVFRMVEGEGEREGVNVGEGLPEGEPEGEGEGEMPGHTTLRSETGDAALLLLMMNPKTWLWPAMMPPICRRQSGKRYTFVLSTCTISHIC